jgi:hypothetical protein
MAVPAISRALPGTYLTGPSGFQATSWPKGRDDFVRQVARNACAISYRKVH